MRIDRDRARTRRVDADADDPVGLEAALFLRLREGAFRRLLQAEEVVAGMLPGALLRNSEIVLDYTENDAKPGGRATCIPSRWFRRAVK